MNRPVEKARYRYIDYFKAIAIILVIVGHANFSNGSIKPWIYAFHMPAFFFASGLLLKNKVTSGIAESFAVMRKKFIVLIIPYFVWAMIYTSLTPKNVMKIIYGSHILLKSAGTLTSLWFITSLFLSFLYYEIARLIFGKRFGLPVKTVLMAVTFVIAAVLPVLKRGYPWNVNVSFCAFGFLLLGNILFPAINALYRRISGMSRGAGIAVCLLLTAVTFAGTFLYNVNFHGGKGLVNTARANYGTFPLYLMSAVIGSLFIMALAFTLDMLLPKGKGDIMSFIGRNTFTIYVTHKPFVQILFKRVFTIFPAPVPVILIVTCIGTLLICSVLTVPLDRYLPVLTGKIPSELKKSIR